ncbi:Multidrug resistance efflux pump [Imperialibacter sp. EC-SDR9]|nr:Multidrug efflux pump subunit AcrA (Membrane-fusion protein) [Imperialibacter sp. 75]CAD5294817.1 Multidrug efflux pump subunit AcrA (Membrane-fusion protein) [Imperialibacter sp. 89]VVT12364.1 Multidrug resistance efflux pump [Imperialibacter sp. EC-SDR9]
MRRHGLMIIAVLVLTAGCKDDTEKVQPTVEAISESVYASGTVKTSDQYQAFSSVNGIVEDIFVAEGDKVPKGAPLLKISNKASLLNVRNAQLTAENAKLSENQQKLDEAKMSLDFAKAKLANDSSLLARKQHLWKQDIGTRVELEQATLAYENAVVAYQSAKTRYDDLQRQLALNARQSSNNLQISSTLADEYIIKSEIDGRVFTISKEIGELVNVQSPVALLGDDSRFYLELQVDEYDIVRIKTGQLVFVSMDSYKGEVFEAVVTRVIPAMNERSKSFTVVADFVSRPQVLYPFLTAEANIVIQTKKDALTIPRQYLVDESFVLLENDEKRAVVTGLKDYEKVEIISGLAAGEYIIKPEN